MRARSASRRTVLLIVASVAVLGAACVPLKAPPPPAPGLPPAATPPVAQLSIDPPAASLTDVPNLVGDDVLFTVTNVGGQGSGALGSVLDNGVGVGAFDIITDSCDGSTLAVNAVCHVRVRYTNDAGGGAGAVDLRVSATPGGAAVATIEGEGLPVVLAIDPTSADLTDTPGAAGDVQAFTITNNGAEVTGPLTSQLVNFGGDGFFGVGVNTCGVAVLGPGASCVIEVLYTNNTGSGSGSVQLLAGAKPGGGVIATITGEGLP